MWLCERRPTEQNHAVAFPVFNGKEKARRERLNQNYVLNLCWESVRVDVDSKILFLEMSKHYHKVENQEFVII